MTCSFEKMKDKIRKVIFSDVRRQDVLVVIISVCFFFVMSACFLRAAGPSRLIEGVPFYEQEENQCGPASLAGLINFYGVRITPQEISKQIFSPTAGGTLDLDMVLFTQRRGLSARQYKGGLEDLKKQIDRGRPLIILVDYGFFVYQRNHYMVVIGYDGEGVIVHSGKEKNKFIPFHDLAGPWERAGFWTLLVVPKAEK